MTSPRTAAPGRTGWAGGYDLELFSDDGTFGDDFEDSLWKLPAEELARRGRRSFVELEMSSSRKGRAA